MSEASDASLISTVPDKYLFTHQRGLIITSIVSAPGKGSKRRLIFGNHGTMKRNNGNQIKSRVIATPK